MEKLLIADDEKIVVEALQYIINKNFPGEFQVFTAKSGREAILRTEQSRIDIAFMDISMPGISGIQAIEQIQQQSPDSIFVILTAYDKFDYAKTALRMGVFDYLLKPIRREKIIEVLGAAKQKLAARKSRRLYELDVSERLEKANIMLEKELISSIISPHAEELDLREHLRILELEALRGYSMVLEFDEKSAQRLGAKDGYDDAVGGSYYYVRDRIKTVGSYIIGSFLQSRLVVLRIAQAELSEESLAYEGEKICKKLLEAVGARVHVGIGHFAGDIQQASGSYYAAQLALRFAQPGSPVVLYSSIKDRQAQEGTGQENSISKPVQETIAYIDSHYSRELSLDLLAEVVNISPNYLSKLFKDETGHNFVDYITEVRVNKAKLLLQEKKYSIKEVSSMVGYRDSSYFTRIFKKATGLVPSDFQ